VQEEVVSGGAGTKFQWCIGCKDRGGGSTSGAGTDQHSEGQNFLSKKSSGKGKIVDGQREGIGGSGSHLHDLRRTRMAMRKKWIGESGTSVTGRVTGG
jgi:hypothetical protein